MGATGTSFRSFGVDRARVDTARVDIDASSTGAARTAHDTLCQPDDGGMVAARPVVAPVAGRAVAAVVSVVLAVLLAVAVAVVATVDPRATATSPGHEASAPPAAFGGDYVTPLPGPVHVLRGFSPPTVRYGPGHLGVDLAAAVGEPVRAPAAGVVEVAGPLAGRGVVVVRHPDGVRTEYEPVRAVVHVGAVVVTGTVLGVVAGRHPGCAATCLHWGARRGASYLDPLTLLTPLGTVRLVPWIPAPG